MAEKESLHTVLKEFYHKIYGKIIEAKKTGLITVIPYERVRVKAIDYQTEGYYYDWENIEYFEVYEWSTDAFHDFWQSEIKTLPEFEKAVSAVCKEFQVPEAPTKDAGIFSLVRLLMINIPNNVINDHNIDLYIQHFINDYKVLKEKSKTLWHVKLSLQNIYIESDITIEDKIMLRKSNKDELILIRPKSHHISDREKMFGYTLDASAKLEFNTEAGRRVNLFSSNSSIKEDIENWLDILRLFKVGNVIVSQQCVTPESVMEYPATNNIESPFDNSWIDRVSHIDVSNYQYTIKEDETTVFIEFAKKLFPILSSLSKDSYLKGKYLDLAFHRYKDVLLRSQLHINRVVSSISALEALLSNSSTDINYKISIYVSGILRHFGFNTKIVFDNIKAAYDIRSTFAHGSELKEKQINFLRMHTHEVVNYTRICLLVSLQLKDIINKDEFIKKLNYSLIDHSTLEEIAQLMKDNVNIPILNQFNRIEA